VTGEHPSTVTDEQPSPASGREVAARIGTVGVWSPQLQWQPASLAKDAVAEMEELGFGAVWIGEATGKEVLTHAALLLSGSRRIVVATGIASIWGRDPMAMANAGRTLAEAFPGRFMLGLGVSHPFLTEPRDRIYRSPLSQMRAYLDGMDRAPYVGPPAEQAPRVLAALGPKMLALARDRTAGAHPYFVPVEHTAAAREVLGPHPLLAPEVAVSMDPDRRVGGDLARPYVRRYVELESYANNLRRLGWAEDMAAGGSTRLVDAMVALGGVDAALARIREHLDAGADHVAVRVLLDDHRRLPMADLRQLAAALRLPDPPGPASRP
jgi:probable F420-dependent oxidoreductase